MAYEKKYVKRNQNSFNFTGNIGKIKALKYFDNGGCVLAFSVANSQDYMSGEDEKKIVDRTIWFDCEIKGKWAESLHKSGTLQKVKTVAISGKIDREPGAWINENTGKAQASIRVTVEAMEYLVWKDKEDQEDVPKEDEDEDDVPF